MSDPAPHVPILSDFEGLPVVEAGIEIPGAAGGLREAMRIDPQTFHKGEQTFVVLECKVGKVRFDPIDTDYLDGPQRRVHVFTVTNATMVDGDLVRVQLSDQAERIRLAKEAEAGVQRLPMDDEGEYGLAHARGEHASGLVDGCPVCQSELDALDREASTPTPITGRRKRTK
jgi:hypothetical protein